MWQDLHTKSGRLVGPYIAQNIAAFPLSFDHISNALDGAKRDKGASKLNYFRGYIGGREDYSLAEQFLEYDLSPHKIQQSILAAFGGVKPKLGKNAGLIVNGSLQWSDLLQDIFSTHALQLALLFPDQKITFDLTLFIGAYGSTPFGVHIDDASHRTILFNLGPGEKGVSLWQNEDIHRQFGKVRNILNPASISAAPKKYFFKAGEAFVLPSMQYHIGLNSTLSTTAAIVVDIVTDGMAAAREAQSIGIFFDAIEQEKKHDLWNIRFKDLVRFNNLRNISNHFLRFSPVKKDLDISKVTRCTFLKPTQTVGIKVASLNSTSIIFSRGYHHIHDQNLEEATFESMPMTSFDVDFFLSLLPPSEEAVKSKLLLLKFLIETGSLEILS